MLERKFLASAVNPIPYVQSVGSDFTDLGTGPDVMKNNVFFQRLFVDNLWFCE
jgi:hypothetical protein